MLLDKNMDYPNYVNLPKKTFLEKLVDGIMYIPDKLVAYALMPAILIYSTIDNRNLRKAIERKLEQERLMNATR